MGPFDDKGVESGLKEFKERCDSIRCFKWNWVRRKVIHSGKYLLGTYYLQGTVRATKCLQFS